MKSKALSHCAPVKVSFHLICVLKQLKQYLGYTSCPLKKKEVIVQPLYAIFHSEKNASTGAKLINRGQSPNGKNDWEENTFQRGNALSPSKNPCIAKYLRLKKLVMSPLIIKKKEGKCK